MVPVAEVNKKFGIVTCPFRVSAVKMDEEAAVNIWKAVVELVGVWNLEVP